MSLPLKITLGLLICVVISFSLIARIIATSNDALDKIHLVLTKALNVRYMKLKNVLNFLKRHMEEYHLQINELIKLVDEGIETSFKRDDINEQIALENTINFKLEEIKSRIADYASVQDDNEIREAIIAIIESEANVNYHIKNYNSLVEQYNEYINNKIVAVANLVLSRKESAVPFVVQNVQEFDDNYVDEDEI